MEDTPTSALRSLAAGEARLSGRVVAAELTLTSPLQSVPCVYYRSRVEESHGRAMGTVFNEERGVGFKVRDGVGEIRIFPNGARWDIPDRFSDRGAAGEDPPGLDLRRGPVVDVSSLSREEATADLSTVRRPEAAPGGFVGGPRMYREARLEPGDTVTVVGMVLPFDQLPDPAAADEEYGAAASDELGDPEVAADLAEGRASGAYVGTAEEAWGNAAIPGFGIGRPTREPTLDSGARPIPLASVAQAAAVHQRFDSAPETLVVARTRDVPLLIASGSPTVAAARDENRFLVGLLGAVLAICSALALALLFTQGVQL